MRPIGELAIPTLLGLGGRPFAWGIGHVRQEHLQHHALAGQCTLTVGVDLHALGGLAAATWRERALALHFHHTGAAIAVGAIAWLVAQAGHFVAQAIGHLQQSLARMGLNSLAIELETDGGQGSVHVSSFRV